MTPAKGGFKVPLLPVELAIEILMHKQKYFDGRIIKTNHNPLTIQ